MKLIIAGSRQIGINANGDQMSLSPLITKLVKSKGWDVTEVVSGGARGVDLAGEMWAQENGILIKQFIPDWNGYAGKRAGFVRNTQMAGYADALLAIWDGESRGTAHMVKAAAARKLHTFVYLEKTHA